MRYKYKKGIRFFIQSFSLLIISSVFLTFVKCALPTTQFLESGSEPECDIYTERCLRSGSGFDVRGSGGALRREDIQFFSLDDIREDTLAEIENDARNFVRDLLANALGGTGINIDEEDLTDDVIDQLTETYKESETAAEEALEEICDDYEDMFSKVDDRLKVGTDLECIMFNSTEGERILYCPVFEYVNGCLRVQEVDDPITPEEESDNFNTVCLNEDYQALPLSEDEREELRDGLEKFESREALSSTWEDEKDDLSEDDLAKWYLNSSADVCDSSVVSDKSRNDVVGCYEQEKRRIPTVSNGARTGTGITRRGITLRNNLTCDGTSAVPTDEDLTGRTVDNKNPVDIRYGSSEIKRIYKARNEAYVNLSSFYKNNGVSESRLKRNVGDIIGAIDEMYRTELALAKHETELIICERKLELYNEALLRDLNKDLEDAQDNLEEAKEELEDLEDATEEQIQEILDMIANVENDLGQDRNEYEVNLREANDTLRNERASAIAESISNDLDIAEKALTGGRTSLDPTGYLNRAKTRFENAKTEITKSNSALKTAKTNLNSVTGTLSAAQGDKSAEETKLDNTRTKLVEARSHLRNARRDLENAIEDFEEEVEILETYIEAVEAEAREIVEDHIPGIEERVSKAEEALGEDEDEVRDKAIEVLAYFHDRLSDSDRKAMVDRLLERQKRELRRIMVRCIYEEDPECLEPLELQGTHGLIEIVPFTPDEPRSIEAREFIIRDMIDEIAQGKECEKEIQWQFDLDSRGEVQIDGDNKIMFKENNYCDGVDEDDFESDFGIKIDISDKPEIEVEDRPVQQPGESDNDFDKRMQKYEDKINEVVAEYKANKVDTLGELDTVMKFFSLTFQDDFNQYFEQPYGLVCADD